MQVLHGDRTGPGHTTASSATRLELVHRAVQLAREAVAVYEDTAGGGRAARPEAAEVRRGLLEPLVAEAVALRTALAKTPGHGHGQGHGQGKVRVWGWGVEVTCFLHAHVCLSSFLLAGVVA